RSATASACSTPPPPRAWRPRWSWRASPSPGADTPRTSPKACARSSPSARPPSRGAEAGRGAGLPRPRPPSTPSVERPPDASETPGDLAAADLVDPQRPLDVLDRSLAQVLEGARQRPVDPVQGRPGEGAAPGRRHLRDPGGDVDALAEQPAARDEPLADLDPDAELDAVLRGQPGVAGAELSLELHRAPNGTGHRRELRQQTVPHEV